MKMSEVFLLAAEKIGSREYGSGCCYAIGNVQAANRCGEYNPETKAQRFFRARFKPTPAGAYWWPVTEDYRTERVLALCFAAAIAESEGL